MMTVIIIILLAATLIAIGWRRQPHRAKATAHRANNQREILTNTEYLQMLRQDAKNYRCGDMTRPGVHACRRAPGRPCVQGCRGRIDIETNWTG